MSANGIRNPSGNTITVTKDRAWVVDNDGRRRTISEAKTYHVDVPVKADESGEPSSFLSKILSPFSTPLKQFATIARRFVSGLTIPTQNEVDLHLVESAMKNLESTDAQVREAAIKTLTDVAGRMKAEEMNPEVQALVPPDYANYDPADVNMDVLSQTVMSSQETLDGKASHDERSAHQERIDADVGYERGLRERLTRQHIALNYIRERLSRAKASDSNVKHIAGICREITRARFLDPLVRESSDSYKLGRKESDLQARLIREARGAETADEFLARARHAQFYVQTGRMLLAYDRLEKHNNAIASAKSSTNKAANFFLGAYYATVGIHKTIKALATGDVSDITIAQDSNDPMKAAELISEGRKKILEARSLYAAGITRNNAKQFQRLIAESANDLKQAPLAVEHHGEMLGDIQWTNMAASLTILAAAVAASAMTAGWTAPAVAKLAGESTWTVRMLSMYYPTREKALEALVNFYSTVVASSSFHIAHTGGEMVFYRHTPTLYEFSRGAGKSTLLFLLAGSAMRKLNAFLGIEPVAHSTSELALTARLRALPGKLGEMYGVSPRNLEILNGTIKASASAKARAWSELVLTLTTKGSAHFAGEIGIFMGAERVVSYAAGEKHQASSIQDMALTILLLRRVNKTMEPHVRTVTLRSLEKSIRSTRAKIEAGGLTDAQTLSLSMQGMRSIAAYRELSGNQSVYTNEFDGWHKNMKNIQPAPTFWARSVTFVKDLLKGTYRLRVNPGRIATFPGNIEVARVSKNGATDGASKPATADQSAHKTAEAPKQKIELKPPHEEPTAPAETAPTPSAPATFDLTKSFPQWYEGFKSRDFDGARQEYEARTKSSERAALHEAIIGKLLDGGTTSDQPYIIFTAGTMGSGKSRVLQRLKEAGYLDTTKAIRVDPDQITEMIPEYNALKKINASEAAVTVHYAESVHIRNKLYSRALKQGKNLIVDGSLRDHVWHSGEFSRLRREYPGYKIIILYVNASYPTSLARAQARGRETGRHTAEKFVHASSLEVPESVRILGPLADRVVRVNNEGEPVVEMLRSEGTEMGVEIPVPTVFSQVIIDPLYAAKLLFGW